MTDKLKLDKGADDTTKKSTTGQESKQTKQCQSGKNDINDLVISTSY